MLKNDAHINISADDHERKSEVIDSLAGFEDINICTRRLPIGDYKVDNRMIVERKT